MYKRQTEDGVLAIRYVSSEKQHADILTKALPRELFQSHLEFVLGMASEK